MGVRLRSGATVNDTIFEKKYGEEHEGYSKTIKVKRNGELIIEIYNSFESMANPYSSTHLNKNQLFDVFNAVTKFHNFFEGDDDE